MQKNKGKDGDNTTLDGPSMVESRNIMMNVQGDSAPQIDNATISAQPPHRLQNDGFNALPRVLFLQLDNCGSENKNQYVFAFFSLVTARGIFEMVHLGFLMVDHTPEDVDAMFSRFSKRLRSSCVFTFCQLMDAFIESSCFSPIPYLMQEIPDFKSFIKGYICDGADAFVGHKKPL